MKKVLLFPALLLLACGSEEPIETPTLNEAATSNYHVIPQPREMKVFDAKVTYGEALKIYSVEPHGKKLITDRLDELGYGWSESPEEEADIVFKLMEAEHSPIPEAYSLKIGGGPITVLGADNAGLFYGALTFLQLLPLENQGALTLDFVEISDSPAYKWRGMHLDVCRHYFPKAFVKRYIDLMAHYKMNTFHWHLTEDQGWRIEIEKYPKLTEIGSQREETIVEKNFDPFVGDGQPYGGYFSKEDIREIVAYAETRYVTIVPEIEMPGHSLAALTAYPEYSCTGGPFKVGTKWGVFEDIYCAGNDETFTFMQDILTEVMELFPGKYIHIGGDEAPKARWEECSKCQKRIADEGLKDAHELQSYFIRRIEKFLLENDRQLIGWDEILEGGLAPQATVMSWRGESGGIAAASDGHDVVMTPGFAMYFDHYQADPAQEPLAIGGFTNLEKVYHYNPMPKELNADKAHHVLGAQANVWTEYMHTTDHVEYMVYPRLLALSEVVWSDSTQKDWEGFLKRLEHHYSLLDQKGVNYHIPEPYGLSDTSWVGVDDRPRPYAYYPGGKVVFTKDGSEPNASSTVLTEEVMISVSDEPYTLKARLLLPDGRMSNVVTCVRAVN